MPVPGTPQARAGDLITWAFGGVGLLLLALVASVPLAAADQTLFAAIALIGTLVLTRFTGRAVALALVAVSLAMSLRYLYWRITETLHFSNGLAAALGGGLMLAEIYAVAMLLLFYLTAAWPRHRPIRPLPPDPASWPTVDVMIPTYNEPLAVVRASVLAALALDWPAEQLRVWLLDDGRRDEFRRFATQIGCGYIARPDNEFAKAGNLNRAISLTTGAFIAVFDCDHVPTRAFLQLTMGWLAAEPNLALVQTAQHFYGPDPFQRNLAAGRQLPAESALFHGLLQDGHDFWNTALFSGSCAVLRRTALAEIGGIDTGSLTEDAGTSLKLHRAGWQSAYLGLPLAAGLAPHTLSAHIAQRRRWTRGMLQIFRLDNPLLGRGLTLVQRLGYLQATGHFLFALPRLAFLTAPLAFLLLGQNIIAASPLAITAYAVPHLVLAVAASSRLRGKVRHAFWGEIYETVLALALIRVTIGTLLRPLGGRFVVTPKESPPREAALDLMSILPNIVLAALLLAGLVRAAVAFALFPADRLTAQALAMNAVWAVLALLVVLASLAVGRETRQGRHPRIAASLPVRLTLPDGRQLTGLTSALSLSGGSLVLESMASLVAGMDVEVKLTLAAEEVVVPSHVLRADAEGVQLRWEPHTLEQESCVIRAVFGRADAWTGAMAAPVDRPLVSLGRVLASIGGLFRGRVRTPAGVLAALLFAALPALADSTRSTVQHGTTVRPIPGLAVPLPPAASEPGSLPAQPVPPPPAAAPTSATGPSPTSPRPGVRQVALSLRQLGAPGPLVLRGTSDTRSLTFGIRADEVVTAASLTLSGAMSPSLLPEFSNINVTLNEQYVGTIPASRDKPDFTIDLPISPVFFQDYNRIGFQFAGRYSTDCNDPLSGLLHATIYDASTLTLTLERLPPQRDLSRLPAPFFDTRDRQKLTLPIVLPPSPGNDALRAAAIAASWFGAQTGAGVGGSGAEFPAFPAVPASGNAVVIAVGADPGVAGLAAVAGPTLAVVANPTDPHSSLLVIAGRTGEEAVAAASALALGTRTLGGPSQAVTAPAIAPRVPYDAPNWIATNRPVKLGELVEAADLQSEGYTGLLRVPFRTAPDFFTWRDAPFPLDVRFRVPPAPVIDLAASRLDVGLNGIYLATFPLARDGSDAGWLGRQLGGLFGMYTGFDSGPQAARTAIPVSALAGSNELQFYFDARPLHRGECAAMPADLRMAIDPDSTIDFSGGIRFTRMPNLAFFASSGFPFTRMADLSETAVVLPERPGMAELGAFLDMMGRLGAATGFPVVRVTVTRPEGAAQLADHDLLVIGTLAHLPGLAPLLGEAPIGVGHDRLVLALPSPLDSVRQLFGDPAGDDRRHVAAVLSGGLSREGALLVGSESPFTGGRSVVALLAPDPEGLTAAAAALRDPAQAALVQGDLALLNGGQVSSYRIGAGYMVGSLPFWLWPGWALHDQPVGLAVVAALGCLLLGLALWRGLRRRARAQVAADAQPAETP